MPYSRRRLERTSLIFKTEIRKNESNNAIFKTEITKNELHNSMIKTTYASKKKKHVSNNTCRIYTVVAGTF